MTRDYQHVSLEQECMVQLTVKSNHTDDESNRQNHHHEWVNLEAW